MRGEDGVGGQARGEGAVADPPFKVRSDLADPRIGPQASEQPIVDHRPHPVDLLAAPAGGEFAGGVEGVLMLDDLRPDGVQPRPLHRAARQHRGVPVPGTGGALQQPQRAGEFPGGTAGVELVRPVGLVHRDDVGELQHPLLDALELIPRPGQGQEQEGVDHVGDGRLRLADADRLDQDDVVARRLHDDHRLAGRLGDATERPRGGRGPDERRRIGGQRRHPGLVPQDAAAGTRRGGVDGEHRHLVPLPGEHGAQRVDERRLAHPGHPGDADPTGLARVRQQRHQQPLRELLVVGPGGLDEGDGPRDPGPRRGQHPVGVLARIDRSSGHHAG